MARHCTECGFVNAEGANYCQRCGSFVGVPEPKPSQATTATYVIDEKTGELRPVEVESVAQGGGALVIRSGGGRVGQSFPLHGDRMVIGRWPAPKTSPADFTAPPNHTMPATPAGGWYLDDSGSLNGTYVNRKRVDSHRLEDSDELQVGKYKLTYLAG